VSTEDPQVIISMAEYTRLKDLEVRLKTPNLRSVMLCDFLAGLQVMRGKLSVWQADQIVKSFEEALTKAGIKWNVPLS